MNFIDELEHKDPSQRMRWKEGGGRRNGCILRKEGLVHMTVGCCDLKAIFSLLINVSAEATRGTNKY